MASTRREILTALLGLPVGLACSKRRSLEYDGSFVDDLAEDGHRLRDGSLPAPTGEPIDIPILILGGGIAGLSAGRRLRSKQIDRFLIVEMASDPGGTARSGRSPVTRYPWGAHYLPTPSEENTDLRDLLREVGSLHRTFEETHLVAAPKERVFHLGEWHKGLYPPCDGRDLVEYQRFEKLVDGFRSKRFFAIPTAMSSEDPSALALDHITMTEWLEQQKLQSPLLRWYVDYACRDDFGLSSDQTSAWYGLHYFASRTEDGEFLTWPEGNGFLVDHLVQKIGRERFLLDSIVTRVAIEGQRANISLYDRKTRTSKMYRADRVIFALPSYLRSRLLDAPKYSPHYAPWLVANVHLKDRPRANGFEPAWDNVIAYSKSLGYVIATHQSGPDHGPTVWTYYLPFADGDDKKARAELLSLSWKDAADAVASELDRVHVDFAQHVQRIDIMRWGHGMVQPRPGLRTDLARRRAQERHGPISFAHSDLSGVALFEEAFFHGQRAADEAIA